MNAKDDREYTAALCLSSTSENGTKSTDNESNTDGNSESSAREAPKAARKLTECWRRYMCCVVHAAQGSTGSDAETCPDLWALGVP